MKNALDSLYGQGHVDATRTRECVAMPGKREQTIRTPAVIWDFLHEFWPDGVELDPCAVPEHAFANTNYVLDQGQDGLVLPWRDHTYCNPPYGELKKWMEKSYSEQVEHIMLVPVRTHRAWFRLNWYNAVAFLKPLKFQGFKQAFPAPLCLMYLGWSNVRFANVLKRHGLATQCIVPRSL